MRNLPRIALLGLFFLAGFLGTVEAQPQEYDPDPETIQYITNNQDAYVGRSVQLPEPVFVRSIDATSDDETRSFVVQDEAGDGLRVFTTGELPQVDESYRVSGTVRLQEGSQTPYLFASTIEPTNDLQWLYFAIGGLLVAIVLLGGYVVLGRDEEEVTPEVVDLQGPREVSVGDEVGFTARADREATPVDYEWHFGDDGTIKVGQTVKHVFNSAGSHKVMVTAQNDAGEDSRSMSVEVEERPGPVGADAGQPGSAESTDQNKTKVIDTDQIETTVRSKKTVKMLGWFDVLSGHDDTRIPLNVPLGDGNGSSVAGHEFTIGRKSASDGEFDHIRLKPRTVSRQQAKLSFVNGAFRLTSYVPESKNPTIVNGNVLGEGEQVELSDGDSVTMGEVKLQLQLHSSARA